MAYTSVKSLHYRVVKKCSLIPPTMSRLFATAATRLLTTARPFSSAPSISAQIRGISTALLAPSHTITPSLTPSLFLRPQPLLTAQTAGLKYVPRPSKRCKDCFMYVKDEITYVDCKTHPRHKQATKSFLPKKVEKKIAIIMTHATQGGHKRGNGRGRRGMWTQQGQRMDY